MLTWKEKRRKNVSLNFLELIIILNSINAADKILREYQGYI